MKWRSQHLTINRSYLEPVKGIYVPVLHGVGDVEPDPQ